VLAQRQDQSDVFAFEAADFHVREHLAGEVKKFLQRSRENGRTNAKMQIANFCSTGSRGIIDSSTEFEHELLCTSVKPPPSSGQRDTVAIAFKQGNADMIFNPADLATDCGTGDA
jgi:hypothetical protein